MNETRHDKTRILPKTWKKAVSTCGSMRHDIRFPLYAAASILNDPPTSPPVAYALNEWQFSLKKTSKYCIHWKKYLYKKINGKVG